MSYYTHRECKAIFSKSIIESLPDLPRYFIAIPHDEPNTKELWQFLNQKYTFMFQCGSQRFPVLFFELKKE
jgi:hypothetical protein